MKHSNILLTVLFSLLIWTGCRSTVVSDETRLFDHDTWNRFAPQTFEAEIDDIEDCYNFILTTTIDTALFADSHLPLIFNIFAPNGEQRQISYDLPLKGKERRWVGEPQAEGRIAHTRTIRQYFFFNVSGKYKIEVKQCTPRYDLAGIHSIAFRIERAQLDYPE